MIMARDRNGTLRRSATYSSRTPNGSAEQEGEPIAFTAAGPPLLGSHLSGNDFKHVTQVGAAGADYFLTSDRGILARSNLVAELGLLALTPCELEAELRRRKLISSAVWLPT